MNKWMFVFGNLIYSLYDFALYMLTFTAMYCIKRFVFLESNTQKQKKTIKKIAWGVGIFYLAFIALKLLWSVLWVVFSVPFDFFNIAITIITVLMMAVPFIVTMYSSVTGRKKAKWLGLFSVIPLYGYVASINALINMPKQRIHTAGLGNDIYLIVCFTLLSLFLLWLFYGKKRPQFILKIETDIENRSLSFWEELSIWLIGIWLLVYDLFIIDKIRDILWIKDIAYISNLILAIMVTAFVISSSYRKYYYEKNLKYQKTLITTMANLVESRDDNTGGHIHRTAKYVEIIAKKLQSENKFKDILTDQYIEDMVVAAPLHDVGKIHISDVVLNKPGKLSDEEFAAMKTHSSAGGEIIGQVEEEVGETISYLDIAKEMAEYHHERMDGNGYPHGISGEQIPLCARILAVADVFDALISKRCYKAAMPLDKAFAIIQEETGDHFDADVANAFLASRDEVVQFLSDIAEEETAGKAEEAE